MSNFKLRVKDKKLGRNPKVKKWLKAVEKLFDTLETRTTIDSTFGTPPQVKLPEKKKKQG